MYSLSSSVSNVKYLLYYKPEITLFPAAAIMLHESFAKALTILHNLLFLFFFQNITVPLKLWSVSDPPSRGILL